MNIRFSPASEQFAEAAREYQSLWEAEGSRIIEALEHVSGLKFAEQELQAMVYEGISLAVEDAVETYRNAFTVATRTSKPSRYPRILSACAYAKHDDNGVFRATDVVDAMQRIFQDAVSVPSVVPALGEFCNAERGPILSKVPVGDRSHYRFIDPMFRPFLRIKAKSLL